jgi:competence ComEA-like helix-hairpin-helix protein
MHHKILNMGRSITDELYLTRKERFGILLLFLILSCSVLWPLALKQSADKLENNILIKESDRSEIPIAKKNKQYSKEERVERQKAHLKTEPQNFDPNSLDEHTARKVGFPMRAFNNLKKYLDKGGKIHRPEQLKNIYGITQEDFHRLEPYISIVRTPKDSQNVRENSIKPDSLKMIPLTDINTAGIEELDKLPGIGLKLAERILRFREALGGFTRIEQICEVYGIKDSICTRLIPRISLSGSPRKMKINSMDSDELDVHPYLSKRQSDFIVKLRRNLSRISGLEQLMETGYFDTVWMEKISPYLDFD